MKFLCIGIFAIGFALATFSQSPQQFNYQTLVRDVSGDALASTLVSFQISILETSAVGTAIYKETHSTTTNTHGLATLSIGAGSVVLGVFEDIQWGTDLHFLKVELDPNGGTAYIHMGTSQLLSTPYSLYSKEAESITDNTLEGKGIRGDSLRIAEQAADSTNVLMWNGLTWIPVDIDILIGGSASSIHNTLDQAYDQGGNGAGRKIVASHGAVQIRNSGNNTALHIEDTLIAGTNTAKHLHLEHGGSANTALIEHTKNGIGLRILSDSSITGSAKNNMEIFNAGNTTGTPTMNGGRAIYTQTINRKNNRPSIEAMTLGKGHAIFGRSGQNDWTTGIIDAMPAAGVAGFSGTEDVGSTPGGSDGPFDIQSYRRGRMGVAGLSKVNHGVWGMTNVEGSFGRNSPDSIIAGVVGVESPYLGEISSNQARYDHFGVAGLTPDDGSGVLGVGSGHGVVGWGGSKESATSAGVWGNTRFSSWTLTQNEYSLVQTGSNNKSKVGVLGTSADRTGVWGESKASVGVAATGGGIYGHNLIELESNVGLFAATTNGTAGKFLASPDTASHKQLMLVKLAEKDKSAGHFETVADTVNHTPFMLVKLAEKTGNAGYFKTESDTVSEAIIKIDHKSIGNAIEIRSDNHPAVPYDKMKRSSIHIEHRADSAAAIHIEHVGGGPGIYLKNLNDDSAGVYVYDEKIAAIYGLTNKGEAGVIGEADSTTFEGAGILGIGRSHADSAAAVEIRDGAIRVSGLVKPAGRVADTIPGGVVFSGIIPYGTSTYCCPDCAHSHDLGFYYDKLITNPLIDGERSHIFLTPFAKPNPAAELAGVTYTSMTAALLGIADGSAAVRISIVVPAGCSGFNVLMHGPEWIGADYLIVNH